jgi:hypothetical protein
VQQVQEQAREQLRRDLPGLINCEVQNRLGLPTPDGALMDERDLRKALT